ncbi:MAG TPA: mannitol-1-phosphate 5-dehydrogenase [Rubrobacteraceae bacterium]|nr:mannitol-1-phosphate 5-dehydrogenase [Rubrobacteraceae bacterium]
MLGVHFGAGNIGRGFIGQLLHESGYDVSFVDVQAQIVEALKTQGRYEVILAAEGEERVLVDRVTAFHSIDEAEEVVRQIARADLVTTAVGPPVLPILAPAIANGLMERARSGGGPLNVIACENMIGGSESLRSSVMEHLSGEDAEAVAGIAGFPNAAVDRIVPEQTTGGIDVLVEPFFEWVVDASQVKGDRPDVSGITYVESLAPYIERKLLTVNTGHAAVAYLGYARGRATISDALEDDAVYEEASGALEETGRLMVEEHGFDEEEHRKYREKTLVRFRNPRITDAVTRVARTPIRKLGRNERLVSPALRLLDRGYTPVHLATVIGAVLRYDNAEDEQAAELQEKVRAEGERAALASCAGIEEDHPLVDLVAERLGSSREFSHQRGGGA